MSSNRSLFFDKSGQPIEVHQWTELRRDIPSTLVAHDTVGEVHIITDWIGIDVGFTLAARPLIYETVVFGGVLDGDTLQYPTAKEARAGHAAMVARVQAEGSRKLAATS